MRSPSGLGADNAAGSRRRREDTPFFIMYGTTVYVPGAGLHHREVYGARSRAGNGGGIVGTNM